MSLAALTTVLVQLATHGATPQPDEGAAAHIFQLLLVAQVPIIVFFAAKWIPRETKRSTQVLLIQISAVLVALAPVYILHW
jgi:hypothetical protein